MSCYYYVKLCYVIMSRMCCCWHSQVWNHVCSLFYIFQYAYVTKKHCHVHVSQCSLNGGRRGSCRIATFGILRKRGKLWWAEGSSCWEAAWLDERTVTYYSVNHTKKALVFIWIPYRYFICLRLIVYLIMGHSCGMMKIPFLVIFLRHLKQHMQGLWKG